MQKNGDEHQTITNEHDFSLAKVSIQRWHYDAGLRWEQTTRLINSNDGTRFHVYEIRAKQKSGSNGGTLLMLKAFGDDGPVIAFHHDNTFYSAFLTVGERLRNGSLQFQTDDWPTKNYEGQALLHQKEVEYFLSKR